MNNAFYALLPLPKLLQEARVDITASIMATDRVQDESGECSAGECLAAAFANLARARRASAVLDLMHQNSLIADNHLHLVEELQGLVRQGLDRMRHILQSKRVGVEGIIAGEFLQEARDLFALLETVRDYATYGDMTNDWDLGKPESEEIQIPDFVAYHLEESAELFLLNFQELVLILEELKESDLSDAPSVKDLEATLCEVDRRFRDYFGYFCNEKSFLQSLRQREYATGKDFEKWWWLDAKTISKLRPEDVAEKEAFSEVDLDRLSVLYRSLTVQPSGTREECSQFDKVISYATGELPADLWSSARKHLIKCPTCLTYFMDVRIASREAAETEDVSVAGSLAELAQVCGKPEHDRIGRYAKRFFSSTKSRRFSVLTAFPIAIAAVVALFFALTPIRQSPVLPQINVIPFDLGLLRGTQGQAGSERSVERRDTRNAVLGDSLQLEFTITNEEYSFAYAFYQLVQDGELIAKKSLLAGQIQPWKSPIRAEPVTFDEPGQYIIVLIASRERIKEADLEAIVGLNPLTERKLEERLPNAFVKEYRYLIYR